MSSSPISLGRGLGSMLKRCDHDWERCKCDWTIRYRGTDRKQHEESGFTTKTKATDKLTEIHTRKRGGKQASPETQLFGPYADTWLSRRRKLADSSATAYEGLLRLHLKPQMEARRLRSIDRAYIFDLVDILEDAGLSPARIQVAFYGVLIPILRSAAVDGLMDPIDTHGIELPEILKTERYFPSQEEVSIITKQIHPHLKFMVLLMAGCGLRVSEAIAVNESCFIGDGILRISQQWKDRESKFGPLKHKKAGHYRDVPVPNYVFEVKEEHKENDFPMRDGFFFPSPRRDGMLMHSSNVRRKIHDIVLEHSLSKEITPHTFRHFFASHAIAGGSTGGTDIAVVAKWLGHRSIQTTYEYYGHLVRPSFDQARLIMDEALRPKAV